MVLPLTYEQGASNVIAKVVFCTCLLLGAALAASAQSRRENQKKCVSSDPDTSIAGCTALIQAGRESTVSLVSAYSRRASAYMRKTDYDRAIQDYGDSIRLNPNDASAYSDRGNAYFYKGDYDRAIQNHDDAIRLNPNYESAYTGRGAAYFVKGDRERAMLDFNEAIRLNPNQVIAYSSRGVVYIDMGDYSRAIQDYDDAIRLNPKYAYAYYNRGSAHIDMGNYDLAVKDFNESIRLNPNFAEAFYNRGDAYLFHSNMTAAMADFEHVISTEPSSALAIYAALMRHVVSTQQGHDDAQQLAPVAQAADLSKWPGPLLKLVLGQIEADEVMAAAANAETNAQKRQVCEANYFTGEDALLHNQQTTAMARFKAARDGCPKGNIGYAEALAELRRLGALDAPAK
jgi:tetratricopeptide (TPR) repeat protein